MIGSADYEIKMPMSEVLMTALVGILTVFVVLALIAVCIMALSKIIQKIEGAASKSSPKASAPVNEAPKGAPLPESQSIGSLELIGTDEATAAIIMAIVSDKSKIPLNRLEFKSIRQLEGEE